MKGRIIVLTLLASIGLVAGIVLIDIQNRPVNVQWQASFCQMQGCKKGIFNSSGTVNAKKPWRCPAQIDVSSMPEWRPNNGRYYYLVPSTCHVELKP